MKDIITGAYGKNKGKKCFQLSSNFSYKSNNWTVCFSDLDKVWKRNDTGNIDQQPQQHSHELMSNVEILTETINHLTRMVEQLKIDVANEQNEKKRIINLIKKLHHIKSA